MLILDVKNRQLIALLITSRSGPSDVRLTDIKLKPKHFVDSTNLLPNVAVHFLQPINCIFLGDLLSVRRISFIVQPWSPGCYV